MEKIESDLVAIKNKWNRIVLTFDYSKRKVIFYLNGTSSVKDVESCTNSTEQSFAIGLQGWLYPTGLFDEVKVYNDFLSEAHIKKNYITGLDSLLSKNLISKEEYNQNLSKLSSD